MPNHFIFGDVHGDVNKLRKLLAQLDEALDEEPCRLYSLGDLIDRGPDSKKVIDLCIERGVELILGNHELWLHEWAANGKTNPLQPMSKIMGGEATLRSYGIDPDAADFPIDAGDFGKLLTECVPQSHARYLLTGVFFMVITHCGEQYVLTHGGLSKSAVKNAYGGTAIKKVSSAFDTNPARHMWVGAKPGDVGVMPDRAIQVFGHTPWPSGPEVNLLRGQYIALDTGCGTCFPHQLSGVLLREDGSLETFTQR
jgi:serine/threonine protein phosphatase 1